MASKCKALVFALLLVLGLSAPAQATYAFIAAVGGGSAAGAGFTTGTASMSGADLLVCGSVSYVGLGGANNTITDSNGNMYSYRTSYVGAAGSLRIAYVQGAGVGSNGMTFTSSTGTNNTYAGLVCAGFSGSLASPYDVENGHVVAGAVTSDQPGSITPGAANELIVAVVDDDFGNGSYAINSSFTIPTNGTFAWHAAGQNLGISLAYKIKTDAAAENPTWSWTTPTSSLENTQAAFKVSGAAVATSPCRLTLLGVGQC